MSAINVWKILGECRQRLARLAGNEGVAGLPGTSTSGASGSAEDTFGGLFGVSVLTLTNPFFKVIADKITEEAAKNGYEVIVAITAILIPFVFLTGIVGIIFEIEFSNCLKRFCVVDFADTAFVIRNKETIEFGDINNPLR